MLALFGKVNTNHSTPLGQNTVEIVCRANQTQMSEGLRKVSQRLATVTDLLCVKAHMISITKHLLEHQARLFNSAGPRQCLNQPEAADAESAFAPADAVYRVIISKRVTMH